MSFIDTHAHLYLNQFDNDIDEVIKRATDVHVDTIILPNIDSASIKPLHNLAERYPDFCVPLMGLHPTHIKENYQQELTRVFSQLGQYAYKGMGEIGIDLYWDKTFLMQQQLAFEQQLDYALENDLPVVIHARDSFNEILEIVKGNRYSNLKGIFHAFTGDRNLAEEIIDLGYLLGIGGIITFKNSHLSDVIGEIDLCHLVLETDSPYLAPTPFRGKRNESSYVPIIADYLAQIKKTGIEEVAEITSANAKKLFQL
jgi:TatD DNase family protein